MSYTRLFLPGEREVEKKEGKKLLIHTEHYSVFKPSTSLCMVIQCEGRNGLLNSIHPQSVMLKTSKVHWGPCVFYLFIFRYMQALLYWTFWLFIYIYIWYWINPGLWLLYLVYILVAQCMFLMIILSCFIYIFSLIYHSRFICSSLVKQALCTFA